MADQNGYKNTIIDQWEYFVESGVIQFNIRAETNKFILKHKENRNQVESNSYFPKVIHEVVLTSGVALLSTLGIHFVGAFAWIHIGFCLVKYLFAKIDKRNRKEDAKTIQDFLNILEFDETERLVKLFSEIFVNYNLQVSIY